MQTRGCRCSSRIRTADVPTSSLSFADLELENSRLAALVSSVTAVDAPEFPAVYLTERYEQRLYVTVGQSQQARTVSSVNDIVTPSAHCSHHLVQFAELWTSRVHFAFFSLQFRTEHSKFWSQGGAISSYDPL